MASAFAGSPTVVGPRAALARAGVPCRHVFLLDSGWALRERLLADGRRAILDVYVAGDPIGLDHLFDDRPRDGVVTLTAAAFRVADRDAALGLAATSPRAALDMIRWLAEEKRRMDMHATRLARLPAPERTAATLHGLCRRLASCAEAGGRSPPAAVRLPLTQEQLADHLGLNPIHVNRTLRQLRAAGVISFEGGKVVVSDGERLGAFLGGDADLA